MTDNCPHCESEKKQRFPLRGGTQFKCGTIIYERYTDEQSAICKRIAELQAQVEALTRIPKCVEHAKSCTGWDDMPHHLHVSLESLFKEIERIALEAGDNKSKQPYTMDDWINDVHKLIDKLEASGESLENM